MNTTTTPSQAELKAIPTWQLGELIDDCYCDVDYFGENTEQGKQALFMAEVFAVELQDRPDNN